MKPRFFHRSTNLPRSLHASLGWRFQSCNLKKWYGLPRNCVYYDHLHIRKMTDTRYQHSSMKWLNAKKMHGEKNYCMGIALPLSKGVVLTPLQWCDNALGWYTPRKKILQWFFRMVKEATWNLLLSEPG